MNALLLAAAALGTGNESTFYWPTQPPLAWQLEGVRLAISGVQPDLPLPRILRSRKQATWNDVLEPETRQLSTWSTGGSHVRSEWAILLTPRGAARWLGFGRVTEGWGEAEVQARWKDFAAELQGKAVVIFCRTSYPRRAVMGVGSDSAPDVNRLDLTDATLRLNGSLLYDQQQRFLRLESRERKLVEGAPWWNSTPLAMRSQPWNLPPLGEYHRDWWMAEVDLEFSLPGGTLSFVLDSPGRPLKAEWKLIGSAVPAVPAK